MSAVFSELRRSERILPVDDKLFLQRISAWHVLFLESDMNPALYERVIFFRRDRQQYSRWMQTVRSSRVAMRQVPFVRPATAAQSDTRGRAVQQQQQQQQQHQQHQQQQQRRAALLAQCERRLCPALLHSPVGPEAAVRLARTAARLSLPAQAVVLFVSATVAYFDAALAAMSPRPQSFEELVEAIEEQCVRRLLDPNSNPNPNLSLNPEPEPQPQPQRLLRRKRRPPFQALLDAALSLWRERRAASVTAAAPLGSLAAPLRLRDVHCAASSTLPQSARVFTPAAPRDLPRERHPLRLAPLAPDPLVADFLPLWERWLRGARRDIAAVAALLDPAHTALDAAPHISYISHTSQTSQPSQLLALADFVCRVGAALWSAQDPGRCVVLTRAQAQFVMAAIERECLSTALRLRERGVQELRVRRASAEELMLTVIRDDGREAEIGRPAGLAAGRTAMGDSGGGGGGGGGEEAPLWLVAGGGLDVAQTFVRHFLRGARPPEMVEDTRVVALTRAEEGVLHHIFQCHPAHFALAGCGVARLLLHADDGQPLLQRVCGAALIAWDLSECYDPSDAARLRRPTRAVPAQTERGGVPLPRGVSQGRVALSEVRGMVRHYWDALLDERRRGSGVETTALFPVDAAVAFYVLRHHPQFLTRICGCGVAEIILRRQRIDGRGAGAAAAKEEKSGVNEKKEEKEWDRDEEFGPTLAVTRPCGMWTAFDYEECYQPVTARLNRPMVLEGGMEEAWAQTPFTRKRPYEE